MPHYIEGVGTSPALSCGRRSPVVQVWDAESSHPYQPASCVPARPRPVTIRPAPINTLPHRSSALLPGDPAPAVGHLCLPGHALRALQPRGAGGGDTRRRGTAARRGGRVTRRQGTFIIMHVVGFETDCSSCICVWDTVLAAVQLPCVKPHVKLHVPCVHLLAVPCTELEPSTAMGCRGVGGCRVIRPHAR